MPINRLTFLCHAPTAATGRAAFPLDEPLDSRGRQLAVAAAPGLGRFDRIISSPALRSRQTAEALGLAAAVDRDVRDIDYGRWAGSRIDEVASREPEAVAAWRNDPRSAPPGGDSVADLFLRVGAFLKRCEAQPGNVLAISHAAPIRAAIVQILAAPFAAFWQIDVEPLGLVSLQREGRFWRLRSLANPRALKRTGAPGPRP